MTKKNLTAIALVVDRSGSMGHIREEAQGALDRFIEEQQEAPGKVHWTVALFDDYYERPAHLAIEPGRVVLEPRGFTALHDAVGRTTKDLYDDIRALPKAKQPSKVIVVVLTDGLENASREWDEKGVAALVKERQDDGWEFIYLATGIDAWSAKRSAGAMNFPLANTMRVSRGDHQHGTHAVSDYVEEVRAGAAGQSMGGLRANVAKTDPKLLDNENKAGDNS